MQQVNALKKLFEKFLPVEDGRLKVDRSLSEVPQLPQEAREYHLESKERCWKGIEKRALVSHCHCLDEASFVRVESVGECSQDSLGGYRCQKSGRSATIDSSLK